VRVFIAKDDDLNVFGGMKKARQLARNILSERRGHLDVEDGRVRVRRHGPASSATGHEKSTLR
jgi:hypothetical protein